MFGREKARIDGDVMPSPQRSPAPGQADAPPPMESVFSPTVSVRGEINFEGAIRIEGEIHGRITGQGRLTISRSGRVVGDVVSAEAVIQGAVQGNITSADRLEIASTAQVVGDLKAARLVVAEGSKVMGRLEINSESITPLPSGGESAPAPEAVPVPDALEKIL